VGHMIFGALMVVAPACVYYGTHRLCPLQQDLSCVLTHIGTNPPGNLVAQRSPSWMIPYLALRMINGIVLGHPRTTQRGFHVEDDTKVR
jgi:hypothetical protein